jgi:hypothetical protein
MMHGPQTVTKNELKLVMVTDIVNNCLDLHFYLQRKQCCSSFVIISVIEDKRPYSVTMYIPIGFDHFYALFRF